MQTIFKKQENVKLPKIIEATLLSSEELEECAEFIKDPGYFETQYWYLRTPYDDDTIGLVFGNCEETPTEPDYLDVPPDGPSGTGLRPVLRLESSILSDGSKLSAGDIVHIGSNQFTAISDTLLLSDFMIGFEAEDNSYGCFDEETNIYEESEAKRKVDKWFKYEIMREIRRKD